MRSQQGASGRLLHWFPSLGRGRRGGLPFLVPHTHFVSRPDLLLLHQRLEAELGYFSIYLMMPNQSLPDTSEFNLEAVAGRILQFEVHNGYLYHWIFFFPLLQRLLYWLLFWSALIHQAVCFVSGVVAVPLCFHSGVEAASIRHISGHYGEGNSAQALNTSAHILLSEIGHMVKRGIYGLYVNPLVREGSEEFEWNRVCRRYIPKRDGAWLKSTATNLTRYWQIASSVHTPTMRYKNSWGDCLFSVYTFALFYLKSFPCIHVIVLENLRKDPLWHHQLTFSFLLISDRIADWFLLLS